MSGECLDGPQGCEGATDERVSLSGSGMAFPRCEFHFQKYAERLQPRLDEIRKRYPDQAPDDFDESYAGETW